MTLRLIKLSHSFREILTSKDVVLSKPEGSTYFRERSELFNKSEGLEGPFKMIFNFTFVIMMQKKICKNSAEIIKTNIEQKHDYNKEFLQQDIKTLSKKYYL